VSASIAGRIAALEAALAAPRAAGLRIGLVPTMGALHQGHGALIERARSESDYVVVSVFVNPIQFNQAEDYRKYHRDLEADAAFSSARGADLVFAPEADEMYPRPLRAFVDVGGLTENLCGAFRPGHFRGVATVVMKLLLLARPAAAYFGEKDFQQLAVIRRMVADLNVPVGIVAVPTVREPDGLAMSSRNRRLSPEERRAGPVVYRALQAASRAMNSGPAAARAAGLAVLAAEPLARVEYFEIVDPEEIQPVTEVLGPVRIACAVWIGETRLIDNISAEYSPTF
jgi:pantoate--beta-alanine ligase